MPFETAGEDLRFPDVGRCIAAKRQRPDAGVDEDIHFRDRPLL